MSFKNSESLRSGTIYALLAYLGWGFFPVYWKLLKHIPFMQILCHRVIWSFVFYTLFLYFREKKIFFYKPKNNLRRNLALGALVLMSNWLVYIYAVNSNQIIESSLGYFINPLVNIMFGIFLLKEKLNTFQKFATLLAAAGVLVITFDQGHMPWIALFLALSFSLYGLIKKTNPVSSLDSNQFESFIMVPFALIFLLTQSSSWMTDENRLSSIALLLGAGLVTGLPLLLFSAAAQKIPYYLMGFFQFLAPTIQFITGVLVFNEPLSSLKLKGFIFIWVAGLLLLANSYWSTKSSS